VRLIEFGIVQETLPFLANLRNVAEIKKGEEFKYLGMEFVEKNR